MGRIWQWQEGSEAALVEEARAVLSSGGLVALPTETFYALAVHPFDEAALDRLFVLKERPHGKPVLLLVAGIPMLGQVARDIPEAGRLLMASFWPGALTLILPARLELPVRLTGGTGTVGVRQPRQPVTCRLLQALDFPVTGTSANRAGRRPLTQAQEVALEFGEAVSLIVDAGPCPGGLASSIVDVTCVPPRLVRAGGVPPGDLIQLIPGMIRE